MSEKAPDIRFIEAAATHPLRLTVLRPGLPAESAVFPGDDAPATFHLGLFTGEHRKPGKGRGQREHEKQKEQAERGEQLACIVSFMQNSHPELNAKLPFQLRGMATAEGFRGRGAGTALIRFALNHLRKSGADLLWCNARENALPFYLKCGFSPWGDLFDIPGVGRHQVMYLTDFSQGV